MSGKPAEHGKLRWPAAVWHALLGSFGNLKSIEFYPRLADETGAITLTSDGILSAIGAETGRWPEKLDRDDLDKALDRARESFEEVKGLTDYQDQKATRLLTVATFMTAFSGALFLRFNDTYAVGPILFTSDPRQLLVVPAYLLFGLFALSAAAGALVTFHATRTRFKYPELRFDDVAGQSADPKSQLFYAPIVQVSPAAWARSFVTPANGKAHELRPDLQKRYLQSYVTETYLIAAKAADKLRYLEPAQLLLSFALGCLLLWLALIAIISSSLDPIREREPTSIRLEAPEQPVPVRMVTPAAPAAPRPSAPLPAAGNASPRTGPDTERQTPQQARNQSR